MQRLSRESLRAGPPKSRDPLSPIIYDTSRQAKKAYNRRKVTPVSAAEKRRIERLRELDERAEKIRCKEERKKQNALKRKQKEEKEGPKKLVKITSSQPELSKFFATKKEHAPATPKREEDRDGFREAEEPSEDPEEQSEPEAGLHIQLQYCLAHNIDILTLLLRQPAFL
ncbi:hypothetical protein DRE_01466 [Drechslerella stenobrocha 248]|uniref:Uncharacterized protein n=1 Tax=Drechslerella stenobrocha 248 TaxID=1043628 RepID=W7HKN6_9PEZI|nr:hypothetical protein DRE_01466 [Drechslerella stenobrocha 248]